MNQMKQISVEKLTLNFGAGKDQTLLKKGILLLKDLTGKEPVQTKAKKRLAAWGLRPGLPIGCKITLRGKKAQELLVRLLKAKENNLRPSMFDKSGNISFGIAEYIDIPESKYNPEIGIIGLQVCITLKRPGYRVKTRRLKTVKVGKAHLITQQDSMDYMKLTYNVAVGE